MALPLQGPWSTAGVNVSNKSQETIDRIGVFSALERWQRLSRDNVVNREIQISK